VRASLDKRRLRTEEPQRLRRAAIDVATRVTGCWTPPKPPQAAACWTSGFQSQAELDRAV
jgi:hypothetical protein